MDGCFHILRTFRTHGAPSRRVRDWTGRWWTLWYAADFVPMGDRVLIGNPHMISPFMDASEIEVLGKDKGRIAAAPGYSSFGETVSRIRNKAGKVTEIRLGGGHVKPASTVAAELKRRYAPEKRRSKR
jgi:hypothetical protein